MTEFDNIKRQINWIVKQINCIKQGSCVPCNESSGQGIIIVDTPSDLNNIPSPQMFQEVSVKSNGHLYIYLGGSWFKQGTIKTVISSSVVDASFVGVPKERISMRYQGGDIMFLPGVTKGLNSDSVDFGSVGPGLEGLEVFVYII